MNKVLCTFLLVINLGCKDTKQQADHKLSRTPRSPEFKESIDRGAGLYNNFCASCHLSGGEGIKGVFPPLNQSDWLANKQKEAIHAIKFGLRGPIKVNGEKYDNLMPALGLSDREIADVMNYINNSWENHNEDQVTEEEVAAIEK